MVALKSWTSSFMRGDHLQRVVYDQIYKVKQAAVQKVALIGSTTSYMAKLASTDVGWARCLKERRRMSAWVNLRKEKRSTS